MESYTLGQVDMWGAGRDADIVDRDVDVITCQYTMSLMTEHVTSAIAVTVSCAQPQPVMTTQEAFTQRNQGRKLLRDTRINTYSVGRITTYSDISSDDSASGTPLASGLAFCAASSDEKRETCSYSKRQKSQESWSPLKHKMNYREHSVWDDLQRARAPYGDKVKEYRCFQFPQSSLTNLLEPHHDPIFPPNVPSGIFSGRTQNHGCGKEQYADSTSESAEAGPSPAKAQALHTDDCTTRSFSSCHSSAIHDGVVKDKVKRFLRTQSALHKSGLLGITLRTAELLKKNHAIQSDIDSLKAKTRTLLKWVLSNPENSALCSSVQREEEAVEQKA